MGRFNFYTVIIGTELLNGRREDSHFKFINKELTKRGWEQKGSFVIDDDPALMESIYSLIKSDEKSVLFSFGGIGATPDDLTREVSAKVFTGRSLETHLGALAKIEKRFREQFKDSAEERLTMSGRAMAELPIGSELIENPFNQIPGYSLMKRFFFLPGFPQMSHPMVEDILNKFFPEGVKKHRETITVFAGEGHLIEIMKKIPKIVECSSLPSVEGKTVFSLSSFDEKELKRCLGLVKSELEQKSIKISDGE